MEEQYAATIKEKVKERYTKIALIGNSDCCCIPEECCRSDESEANSSSPVQAATTIGYDIKELEAIPKSSILGVGCGAPIHYANLKEDETAVDLGSGAGIDVFLAANKVGESGKVIGIDMTDEMLEKARKAAKDNGYTTNVEFRKGDIEKRIPVEENSVDVVISNCVINLTTDIPSTFKEIYRILKKSGRGRMVISDLVTYREIDTAINTEKWCSCIDGALIKDNYLQSIRDAGFRNINVLEEKLYMEGDKVDGRKVTSLVIKAVKD